MILLIDQWTERERASEVKRIEEKTLQIAFCSREGQLILIPLDSLSIGDKHELCGARQRLTWGRLGVKRRKW